MPQLRLTIDSASDAFKVNRDAMIALVADLNTLLARIALGGGEAARERHTGRGKLLPRERIDRLDRKTSCRERV